MKPTDRDPLKVDVFSKDVCEGLLAEIRAMPEARWYLREKINSRPTVPGRVKAHYYFCGDRQQPKELNQLLRELAPVIPGTELGEACINRYDVGSYMPEHVDIAHYRYNLVVMLSDHGDGLLVRDRFIQDTPGQGVLFPEMSAPHSVPPVKHQRFVLIYLYE